MLVPARAPTGDMLSAGFGFVEVSSAEVAGAAIQKLQVRGGISYCSLGCLVALCICPIFVCLRLTFIDG